MIYAVDFNGSFVCIPLIGAISQRQTSEFSRQYHVNHCFKELPGFAGLSLPHVANSTVLDIRPAESKRLWPKYKPAEATAICSILKSNGSMCLAPMNKHTFLISEAELVKHTWAGLFLTLQTCLPLRMQPAPFTGCLTRSNNLKLLKLDGVDCFYVLPAQ